MNQDQAPQDDLSNTEALLPTGMELHGIMPEITEGLTVKAY